MTAGPGLPPRPEPPRRLGETVSAWLAWVGPGRLIVSACSLVVVAAGVAWLVRAPTPPTEAGLPFAGGTGAPTSTLPTPTTNQQPDLRKTDIGDERVVVHVAGSVSAPGVYELDAHERVDGAITAAGGPTASADLDGLNLASLLVDGQRIYVPVVGEVDPTAVPSGHALDDVAGEPAAGGPTDLRPMDLNTATAGQLEQLPGVGPATAAAIIGDRDRHGPFASVGDLERVPGIGPAKLTAIAELVTV